MEKKLPLLLKSHDYVLEQLEGQIKKAGYKTIPKITELDNFLSNRKAYYRWDSYNNEFLKRIFDIPENEYYLEYIAPIPDTSIFKFSELDNIHVTKLHIGIALLNRAYFVKVERLQLIKNRIPLIPVKDNSNNTNELIPEPKVDNPENQLESVNDFFDKIRNCSLTKIEIYNAVEKLTNGFHSNRLEILLYDFEFYLFQEKEEKGSEFSKEDIIEAINKLKEKKKEIPYISIPDFVKNKDSKLEIIDNANKLLDIEQLLFPYDFFCCYQFEGMLKELIKKNTPAVSMADDINKKIIEVEQSVNKRNREVVEYVTNSIEEKLLSVKNIEEKISICNKYIKIYEQQIATPYFPQESKLYDDDNFLPPTSIQVLDWLKAEVGYWEKEKNKGKSISNKIIKIFLASSSELENDRKEFEILE